jgi:hypothetical protein
MRHETGRIACWTAVAAVGIVGAVVLYLVLAPAVDGCEWRCLKDSKCIQAIVAEGIAPAGFAEQVDVGLCRGICSGLRSSERHARRLAQDLGAPLGPGRHPCLP